MEEWKQLTEAGIDMPSLSKRLMGNTALVRMFLQKFLGDPNFSRLQQAIENADAQTAEFTSHTLKGMCGNLSLTALYGLFTQQVALLRSGEFEQAADMMDQITPAYHQAVSHMQQWLSRQQNL